MTNREKLRKLFPYLNIVGTVFMDKHTEQVLATSVNFNWLDAEYKEPTTKNDLEVDLIDREKAIEGAWEIELAGLDNKKVVDMLKDLPSVTPQEPKTEKVIKMRDATPKERESIDKYIKSISKPIGINFWNLEQESTFDELRTEITTLQHRCYALTKGTMCAFCKYECEYKVETEADNGDDD